MSLKVVLVQGGGIGWDQVPAVRRILEAAGVQIEWEEHLAGLASIERGGPPLPPDLLDAVRRIGLALKTKLLSPPELPGVNYNVEFRRKLDLFASIRPLKNLPGLPARFQGVDIVLIRELTEDLYAAIEHEVVPGVVQSLKVVTAAASRRFFQFAFRWAQASDRKTVHCVHKANILKLADGLFLEAFREVAREFPELQPREIIVDNCCMQMVSRPQQFDVMVMGNLYGDLVSDLGAGLVGGISAAAGINVGGKNGSAETPLRVYECFHGGTREHVGPDRANPLPLLLPAVDLLIAEGEWAAAQRIERAVERVLTDGRARTPDLGGDSTTTQVTEAIIAALP